jgi:demethylmenaquinone methyltransferase/2-methoxy-6-polyprenyl-1,4-benzoquinol methylase
MYHSISRVTRSKEKAKENYNRLSHWYDFIAGKSEEKYRNLGFQLLGLKPGEKILEIGFGTGQCLVPLFEAVEPGGLVAGIDLSDGMAAISQRRVIDAGIPNRIGFCLADGCYLPFHDGIFDAVFLSFTLELFDTPEIPTVLYQSRSVLRSGGRLVVVTLSKTDNPGIPEKIYEWFHARMPVMVDCRPIPIQFFMQEAEYKINDLINKSMWGLPVVIIEGIKQ